jgi:calcineurin-like phosphoesterase family protein
MNYYTADEHYYHDGIRVMCNRPYSTINEMNKSLIKKHNEVVEVGDFVYHMGDFCWARSYEFDKVRNIIQKLKGTHILILGNHDDLKAMAYVDLGFQSVHTSLFIDDDGLSLFLCHDPSLSTVVRDTPVLCGHIHDLFKVNKNVINVGVDVNDGYPFSSKDIHKIKRDLLFTSCLGGGI